MGRYRSDADAIVATLIHKPDSVTNGEITVDWFPADASNQYGMQVIRHSTSGYIMNHYIRARRSGNWGGWNRLIKDTDYKGSFTLNVVFQIGTGRLYSSGYTSIVPLNSCAINKITIVGIEELSAEDTTLVLVYIVGGKTIYFSVPDHMANRFSGKACRIEVVLA